MHTFSVMQIYAAEFSKLVPIGLGLVNLPLLLVDPIMHKDRESLSVAPKS